MFEYKPRFLLFLFLFNFHTLFAQLKTGAEQVREYLPLLKNKRVALVVNQTSTIGKTHLVDSLRKHKVNIKLIFAPEHGFRGDHSAGAKVSNSKDPKTGIAIVSLYGKNKKPQPPSMALVDVVIFDIQDVGARFYTYISTLHYVMEACAENNKPLIVLDRPNPNGFYVDGPVLEEKYTSFVGMHPVPIVHGMTMGEYAQMINGEKWLKDSMQCNLRVVKMKNYDHNVRYILPIKPSPNLPTNASIYLYPGLCLFEGTNYSIGRGTSKPFECIGKPELTHGDYYFTPKSIPGVAENPPQQNKKCRGYLLSEFVKNVFEKSPRLYIDWVIDMYNQDTAKAGFFTDFFDQLAGTDQLRLQIIEGKTIDQIRESWQPSLAAFKRKRMNYLLYKESNYSFDLWKASEH